MSRREIEFEQPDLRGKSEQRTSSFYQHPHTGEQVPSVTTISGLIDKSAYLVPWSAKLAAYWAADHISELTGLTDPDAIAAAIQTGADKERSAGRDLGSLAHNTIEAICRGQQIAIPPEVEHHLKGWNEWMERYVRKMVFLEETVWSHRFKYAGTFDCIVEFHDGRIMLVDYKTGSKVHADAALQLNALARADVLVTTDGEQPMPRLDGAGVLHLPAPVLTAKGRPSTRGAWSFREIPLRDVEWHTFQALRFAYDWEKEHSKTAIGGKQTMPALRAVAGGGE